MSDDALKLQAEPTPGRPWRWVAVLTAAALLLRVVGACNSLWVDELFSLIYSMEMRTAGDAFWGLHVDNNHYLNTLWMFLVGRDASPFTFRLPAVIFGTAMVPLAFLVGRRRSEREGVVCAFLVTASYPLIHFASEARGYAGAMFAALLAWLAALHWMERRRWPTAILFGGAACLGLLWHLTFVMVWGGLAVWLALRAVRIAGWRRAAIDAAILHAPPAALLAWLYLVDLRWVKVIGGTAPPAWVELARLGSVLMGSPVMQLQVACAVALAAVALVLWRILQLARRRDAEWVNLVLLIAGPAIVLVNPPSFFSMRYFLVLAPGFYVAMAGHLCAGGRRRWQISAAVMVFFAVGNGWMWWRLATLGRVDHVAAVDYLARETPVANIVLGADVPRRAAVELGYYQRYLPPGRQFELLRPESPRLPDWYMVHRGTGEPEAGNYVMYRGHWWVKMAAFDGAVLSRQEWTFYRPAEEGGDASGPAGGGG